MSQATTNNIYRDVNAVFPQKRSLFTLSPLTMLNIKRPLCFLANSGIHLQRNRLILPVTANLFILFLMSACSKSPLLSLSPSKSPTAFIATPIADSKLKTFLTGAIEQTKYTRTYDPAYVSLLYPGGDVPRDRGVCTDVVIRAFRTIDLDLQKEVHEDMRAHFAVYPPDWGLSQPDPNIDHRRVPNLMTYFQRQGKDLSISRQANAYRPGDIVTWELGQGQQHIGIVTNLKAAQNDAYLIVHNVGAGTRIEDVLFQWPIIGHYRYFSPGIQAAKNSQNKG